MSKSSSSIISKIIIAVSGLVLVLFILGHTAGNLLIYLGQDAMNSYADALKSNPPLLWGTRIAVFVSVILHVVFSIKVTAMNRKAKPSMYAKKGYESSTLQSRSMMLLGITIFLFLIYHLAHFTGGITNPDHYALHELSGRHDVYGMMIAGFKMPLISLIYIIAATTLGLHISHAIQSMAHTLGLNGNIFSSCAKSVSRTVGFLVALGLGSIPIMVLLGVIGGNS